MNSLYNRISDYQPETSTEYIFVTKSNFFYRLASVLCTHRCSTHPRIPAAAQKHSGYGTAVAPTGNRQSEEGSQFFVSCLLPQSNNVEYMNA